MLQRIVAAEAVVLLVIGTITDIKYKRLPLWLLAGFGGVAAMLNAISPMFTFGELAIGVSAGLLLIAVSLVTGGQVGMGDGFLFVVLGLCLGSSNIALLIIALVLCAIVAGVLFATKQLRLKDRLPFVPFVLCAYVIQQFLLNI